MGYMVLMVVAVGVLILLRKLSSPKYRDAMLLATPLGAYIRAREQGASPAAAMMDGLRGLRYREPWSRVSEAELFAAIALLASAQTAEPFKQFILTIEHTRDPSLVRDPMRILALVEAERDARVPSPADESSTAGRSEETHDVVDLDDDDDLLDEHGDDEDEEYDGDVESADEDLEDVDIEDERNTRASSPQPSEETVRRNAHLDRGYTSQRFVLSLKDGLARLKKVPTQDQLEFMASAVLIPLEYETLKRIPCPGCGGQDWTRASQAALSSSDSDEWPYATPSGDQITRRCNSCGHLHIATFQFQA